MAEILGSASHTDAALLQLHVVMASLHNTVPLKAINKWLGRQGSGTMPFWTHIAALNGGSWYIAPSSVLPMILKLSLDYVTHSLSSPPTLLPSLLPHCLAHDLTLRNSVWKAWHRKTERQLLLHIRYLLSIWAKKPIPNVCRHWIAVKESSFIVPKLFYFHMCWIIRIGPWWWGFFYFTWKHQFNSA